MRLKRLYRYKMGLYLNFSNHYIFRRFKHRITYLHVGTYMTGTKLSPPPYNLTAVLGASHITASRGYVDFAINHPIAKGLLEWVQDTGIPDETFFATLQHNPSAGAPGAYTGKDKLPSVPY